MGSELLSRLADIVGERHLLSEREDLYCYGYDGTAQHALPDAVVLPANTRQVAEVLKLANARHVPVVPRGAGTNLSGGTVPIQGGIVLALTRLDQLLEIDRANLTATVQPGLVTAKLHEAVERQGLFYPPDPASYSVSTLGGNVAEGAGGPHCFKYGTTKDYVLGLEVVLASGDVLRTGGKTVKNVSGYDLTHLFVGSEGTLGVVTEITVRLIPLPEERHTMLAVFDTLEDAARLVSNIVAARIVPVTLELMDEVVLRVAEASHPIGLPLDAEAALLIEVDGNREEARHQLERVSQILDSSGARQVRVARTPAEVDELWSARRAVSASLSRLCAVKISEDATVPRAAVPEMVRRIKALAREHRIEVAVFGHAGDGNLHPAALLQDRTPQEMERADRFFADIFRAALELGGTLTGEHGIGVFKARFLSLQHGAAGVAAMKAIKAALDPNGILNPGKIFGQV
ncbi:MAG: FAD-binding protein [Chloroflexota bacterium]|nr:MAG: FAD-binding protein [Chloroflexota bacterium]